MVTISNAEATDSAMAASAGVTWDGQAASATTRWSAPATARPMASASGASAGVTNIGRALTALKRMEKRVGHQPVCLRGTALAFRLECLLLECWPGFCGRCCSTNVDASI